MIREIDFSVYSSIKIGQKNEVFVIEEEGDYSDYFILGRANNVIISPNPPKLAILGKNYEYITKKDGYLYVGAAMLSGRFFSYCKKEDIGGFEYLSHLPGSVGGLVKMNAGLKEFEIYENLVALKFDNGYVQKKDIEYGYRKTSVNTIVYEAVFEPKQKFDESMVEIFRNMRLNQPKESSAGSCFKNPKGDYAGRLIESVGLKGYKIGNAAFSEKHANFLINLGGAKFEDAKKLIDLAKERVKESSGVELELEVILL